MNLNNIYKEVSKKLDIPERVIKAAYTSYWEFIKNTIENLSFDKEYTEEEFNNLRTSFNIPSLGKFYTLYKTYNFFRKKYKNRK